MLKRLRSHWEIKLLALLLSVVLYLYTSQQVRDDTTKSVEVDRRSLVGLPPDLLITDIAPQQLDVDLNGPIARLAELQERGIQPRFVFDAERLRDLRLWYDITGEHLQLHPDVRLRSTTANRIEFVLDRVTTRTLVSAVTVADVRVDREGIVVVEARSEQGQVEVQGPQRVLEGWAGEALPIRPIYIVAPSDLKEPRTLTGLPVKVDLPAAISGRVHILGTPPSATVTIAPAPSKRDLSVPVRLSLPASYLGAYDVQLHDQQITLQLRGPAQRLEDLKADQVTAFIKLPDTPKLDVTEDYVIRIDGPPWLQVESDKVRATVRLREEKRATVPPLAPELPGILPAP